MVVIQPRAFGPDSEDAHEGLARVDLDRPNPGRLHCSRRGPSGRLHCRLRCSRRGPSGRIQLGRLPTEQAQSFGGSLTHVALREGRNERKHGALVADLSETLGGSPTHEQVLVPKRGDQGLHGRCPDGHQGMSPSSRK